MEERDGGKWAAFSGNLLEQFEDRVEYVELDLQRELVEAFPLAGNAEESKSPKHSHSETPSPRSATIIAHKRCTLPKGHTSTGIIGLCIDRCVLGAWGEELIIALLASGSDLMLLPVAA